MRKTCARGKYWVTPKMEHLEEYLVNEYGDLISYRKDTPYFMKRQQYKNGYEYYPIQVGRKNLKVKVHRIVANTFLEPIDGKEMVNHKDGDKTNNHVSNLEWVTASENMFHAYRKLGYKSNGGVSRKKVQCIETGVIYPSVRAAARAIGPGISNTSLSGAAKGLMKKCKGTIYKVNTCGGYHWRFV